MAEEIKELKTPLRILILTWALRIMCGGLFVFSGFVKAIDPWGTIFKMSEYVSAFGLEIPFSLIQLGVFALCAVEFIVGCFLVMGCFRKTCPWFAALIMFVMLPLSLWLAISDPISDCGCFGDAVHLSNWATFGKNVILSAGIVWLIKYNLKCICLITPAFQWLAVVSSGIFLLIIELIGFFYQPLIDFRDYPVDSYLFSKGEDNANSEYLFTYKKGDEKRDFILDSLPDENEGWEFVDRKEISSTNTDKIFEEKGIHVFDVDTADDVTSDLADNSGKELIVMIPNVSEVSPATTWKLNTLYEWSEENDVRMLGIVSGSKEDIDNWEDLSMASYPIYVGDDTTIKEVVRGNPGIVFLDNGIIKWKSTLSSLNIDDFQNEWVIDGDNAVTNLGKDILGKLAIIYLIFIGMLILISFTPRLTRLMTKGGLAFKKGVRHH